MVVIKESGYEDPDLLVSFQALERSRFCGYVWDSKAIHTIDNGRQQFVGASPLRDGRQRFDHTKCIVQSAHRRAWHISKHIRRVGGHRWRCDLQSRWGLYGLDVKFRHWWRQNPTQQHLMGAGQVNGAASACQNCSVSLLRSRRPWWPSS